MGGWFDIFVNILQCFSLFIESRDEFRIFVERIFRSMEIQLAESFCISLNLTGHVVSLASFFLSSFRLNASGSQLFASSGISRLQKTYVIDDRAK